MNQCAHFLQQRPELKVSRRSVLVAYLVSWAGVAFPLNASAFGLSDIVQPVKRMIGAARSLRFWLLDTSLSVGTSDRTMYRECAKRYLGSVHAGDRLLIATIAGGGMDRFSPHVFEIDKTGRKFDDVEVVNDVVARANSTIDAMTDRPDRSSSTRIIETLAALRAEVEPALAYGMDVRGYIFSDSIEDSTLAKFDSQNFNEKAADSLLDKLVRTRLLLASPEPGRSRSQLQVTMVGSGGANAEQYQRVNRFWSAYVMACGGQLTYYGRAAPSIGS